MKAGSKHGLVLAGLGARDSLRLEMGYPLYGLPPGQRALLVIGIQSTFTPISAGLFGAFGCSLNSDFALQVLLQTTGTNTLQNRQMANGTFKLSVMIPNQNTLRGFPLIA